MKKSLILIALFSGLIPFGCTPKCGNGDPVRNFYINSFDLRTSNLQLAPVDTSQFLPYDSVTKLLTIKEKTDVVFNSSPGFSFIASAYACDPVTPVSMETITKIDIISRSNFIASGDTIDAGDTLTTDFLLGEPGPISYFDPITQYLNKKQRLDITSRLMFKYNKQPDANTALKFDLIVTLSNNTVHSFTDQVLKIR